MCIDDECSSIEQCGRSKNSLDAKVDGDFGQCLDCGFVEESVAARRVLGNLGSVEPWRRGWQARIGRDLTMQEVVTRFEALLLDA